MFFGQHLTQTALPRCVATFSKTFRQELNLSLVRITTTCKSEWAIFGKYHSLKQKKKVA